MNLGVNLFRLNQVSFGEQTKKNSFKDNPIYNPDAGDSYSHPNDFIMAPVEDKFVPFNPEKEKVSQDGDVFENNSGGPLLCVGECQ